MEINEIRVLMKYEFHRGATTRQTVANINSVFIIQVATNATVTRLFKKLRSGYFDLSNESHGRPKTQVDSDILKATVEANSSESARELSLMYNDNRKRSLQWLDKDEPPKHCPKRDIHQKLMVTVWWSGSGVIHHSFMEPDQ
ncbi:planarian mariner-8 gene [Nephila pilipes]|uniref:Planarian mariner-8 protein n=1 Tax=Nephila pilipes TaxID=299642 RepID=A0A8X6T2F2_NEPPI|nr:planarian mariner-8 gene [Nephila pilipes]